MERFIRIYRGFFDSREGRNKYHLTASELRTYIAIEQQRRLLEPTYLIHLDTTLHLLRASNTKHNRLLLEEYIQELYNKEIYQKKDREGRLYVLIDNCSKIDLGGFIKVSTEELKNVLVLTKEKEALFYLYLSIKVREQDGEMIKISHQALADINNMSRRTLVRNITKLEELGLLKVFRTSKSGVKQTNKFKTLGFPRESVTNTKTEPQELNLEGIDILEKELPEITEEEHLLMLREMDM